MGHFYNWLFSKFSVADTAVWNAASGLSMSCCSALCFQSSAVHCAKHRTVSSMKCPEYSRFSSNWNWSMSDVPVLVSAYEGESTKNLKN